MNWLHYILEANLYLAVFYALYFLLLDRETYYKLNRVYLLATCVLAYLLPVIQLGFLKPVEKELTILTLVAHPNMVQVVTEQPGITLQDGLFYLYLVGTAAMFIALAIKLIQLAKLGRKAGDLPDEGFKLVTIEGSNTAFSFFNFLFIGTKVDGADTIIRHELVHIRQKHSLDIVFVELIKIISWFNPVIYLVQLSLRSVHEYIADEHTAAYENDTLAYSSFLVSNAYGIGGSSLTHSFFNYNLLKKRIIMLHQKRSGKLARLKYLLAIPICMGLLCVSTLTFSKDYGWITLLPAKAASIVRSPSNNRVAVPGIAPADTVNKMQLTSKGYQYREEGFLINNNKTNYRVIITEKDGSEKAYLKNSATAADLRLLKDKYGYKFPNIPIYAKLPPPPPAPPVAVSKVKFPPPAPPKPPVKVMKVGEVKFPPPAPPVAVSKVKFPPPAPPKPPVKVLKLDKIKPQPPVFKEPIVIEDTKPPVKPSITIDEPKKAAHVDTVIIKP